ncbi:YqzE family protein [Mangrovibacillus cuniculi]|uniref:YqzE family protein n=1 Tax=Mangrovibacillus cuniculi TaxID=2593652 RepID=A0A7S8CBC4_9BACI|nr:YqzE family protein [Mangrovibacillus cuniculi]QPC46854.1 YqzE family protein [Mangrovibacillus cuniculi]
MSLNDYIKFITQQFVKHYNQPIHERKQVRLNKKQQKSPFMTRWFGVIPQAIMLLVKKK